MRNGIVGMDDVEPELARDLHDLVRQRQQVLRFSKQRVRWRHHLMKRQAGLELAQTKRRFSADEMHLMPAASQCFSKLRGHDAAAADRCVTDDADVHARSLAGR